MEVNNKNLYMLQFSNDQVLTAQNTEDLEYMKWGLNINIDKTKYQCIGGPSQNLHQHNFVKNG